MTFVYVYVCIGGPNLSVGQPHGVDAVWIRCRPRQRDDRRGRQRQTTRYRAGLGLHVCMYICMYMLAYVCMYVYKFLFVYHILFARGGIDGMCRGAP